jgi:MmyB-like transcription regulator ligand binding domain
MVLRLAHALDVPLAERNRMLTAAGFAPAYAERPLTDVALAEVRFVLDRLLHAHEPYPALVLDAWYTVIEANSAAQQLLPPPTLGDHSVRPNLIELLLGPYQQLIVNWREVLRDTQQRLQREASARTADARFMELLQRVESAAGPYESRVHPRSESPVLLTQLRTPEGVINTLSTFVYFGSARDVTVEGMHVELIYPADAAADRYFRR